jgi:fimbrial chaperone protein
MKIIRVWLVSTLFSACFPAFGATLQISPVTLELPPNVQAVGITLRNPGNMPIYGQVRVFLWDQTRDDDTLTPTQELVASPPLIQIDAQADQMVRLVRRHPAAVGAEKSYRILIDELQPAQAALSNGIAIQLRYSVPVFIESSGPANPPVLSWTLVKDGLRWLLRVANTGGQRAQIASVKVIDSAGTTHSITQGLLGYALAGRVREWPIKLVSNANITHALRVHALVNAQPVQANLSIQ